MRNKKSKQINGLVPFFDSERAHKKIMKFYSDQLKKSKKRGKNGKN